MRKDMPEMSLMNSAAVVMVVMVILVSIISGSLEYTYIHLDGLPYREARQPIIGTFYYYHLEAIIPVIGLIAFQPVIYEVLSRHSASLDLRRILAFCFGNLLLALILEDATWFMLRRFSPLLSDPLAYEWIRPSDYTASSLGYSVIFGAIIPLWYLILVPPIVAIYAALIVLPKD